MAVSSSSTATAMDESHDLFLWGPCEFDVKSDQLKNKELRLEYPLFQPEWADKKHRIVSVSCGQKHI
eukprot:gene19954-7062_t